MQTHLSTAVRHLALRYGFQPTPAKVAGAVMWGKLKAPPEVRPEHRNYVRRILAELRSDGLTKHF